MIGKCQKFGAPASSSRCALLVRLSDDSAQPGPCQEQDLASMMASMGKPKKTEITEKLRLEIPPTFAAYPFNAPTRSPIHPWSHPSIPSAVRPCVYVRVRVQACPHSCMCARAHMRRYARVHFCMLQATMRARSVLISSMLSRMMSRLGVAQLRRVV